MMLSCNTPMASSFFVIMYDTQKPQVWGLTACADMLPPPSQVLGQTERLFFRHRLLPSAVRRSRTRARALAPHTSAFHTSTSSSHSELQTIQRICFSSFHYYVRGTASATSFFICFCFLVADWEREKFRCRSLGALILMESNAAVLQPLLHSGGLESMQPLC